MNIGFIGAGNMGGALIKGVCKTVDRDNVYICDIDCRKTTVLSQQLGCKVLESPEKVAVLADYLVLAVKPNLIEPVIAQLSKQLKENVKDNKRQVLISIAAGITIDSLNKMLKNNGITLPVIRSLPNIPSEVGGGLILYTPNGLVSAKEENKVEGIFSKCGVVEKVDEYTLEAAGALSGCAPAFCYMFVDALADGGVRCGMPREKAIKYAAQVMKGSAQMVLDTLRHPGRLKDEVCSPAGSTIVGVATLEEGAFRSVVANGVYRANEKNKDLGKK
jgi:pyrroline-5-carboxylate reductase